MPQEACRCSSVGSYKFGYQRSVRALLIFSLLLGAAPAAQAEVRVIDTTSGATSVPVTEPETTVAGWSDDGTALLVRRRIVLR